MNTLLTIINEKKFHNGNNVNDVPLQILLAASNELPKEKAGLEALYDRFIVRTMVNPVKEEDSFFDLCEKSGKEISPDSDEIKDALLSIEEVKAWQEKIAEIALDKKIRKVIMEIRRELVRKNQEESRDEKEKFYVSDRRWKKIIHLLKTSAFLCGRNAVDLMDCQLITYCIWNTAKQREEVQKIVKEIVQEHGLECTTAIEDIEEQIERFKEQVDSTFYKMSEKKTHEEAVITKISGETYFKIAKNQHGIGYVAKTCNYDYYNRHHYYDENKQFQRNLDYIEIDEKTFTISVNKNSYNNYTLNIETKTIVDDKGGLVKDTVLFNNAAAYSATKNSFEKDHYHPIADTITKELQSLEDFRAKVEKPYNENLFANPDFKNVITTKIESEKQKLENAKVSLDKQRSRYA